MSQPGGSGDGKGLSPQDVHLLKNMKHSFFSSRSQGRTLATIISSIMENPTRQNFHKVVDSLTQDDLLNVVNRVFRRNMSGFLSSKQNALLHTSVVLVLTRTLIKKWDGFPDLFEKNCDRKVLLVHIIKYLKKNLDYIMLKKDVIINDFRENDANPDMIAEYEDDSCVEVNAEEVEEDDKYKEAGKCEAVCVESSYCQLKTLFVMDPLDSVINIQENKTIQSNFQLADFVSANLFNWSFVGAIINLPLYKITYSNCHNFEYKLVKFNHNYKPRGASKYKHTSRPVGVNCEPILYRELNQYLHNNPIPANVNSITTNTLKKAIDNIDKVIKKCVHPLKTNTEFVTPSRNSYIRYLGVKRSENNSLVINHKKQIALSDDAFLNVRLQEVIRPSTKFCIEKPGEDNDTGIQFFCTSCDYIFNEIRAEDAIKKHLIMEHGQEPDWFCAECEMSFTMKKLTLNIWHHGCSGKPKGVSMASSAEAGHRSKSFTPAKMSKID